MKKITVSLLLVLALLSGVTGCSDAIDSTGGTANEVPIVTETESTGSDNSTEGDIYPEDSDSDDGRGEDSSQPAGSSEAPEDETRLAAEQPVTIENAGSYYRVVLDYTGDTDPYAAGTAYGTVLVEQVPGIRAALDSFVEALVKVNLDMYLEDMNLDIPDAFKSMAAGVVTEMLYARIPDIEPQIPAVYRDELEGLASVLCDTESDYLGDGMLSKNELYFSHIMGEIARTVQCSATGIERTASATGNILAGRGFDLDAGMAGYGSITELRYPERSVYLVGWLGNLTAFTGFNDRGLFGAIVDTTGSGEPYSSTGIHSYAYDLRSALEETDSVDSAAAILKTSPYGYNHLIFLSDPEKTGVLENNISGTGDSMRREMRYADSELLPGIVWPYDDIVIAVSAFMLSGNHDNFSESVIATSRFDSYLMLLEQMTEDGIVSWEELESIHSYDGTDGVPSAMEFGDIYNDGTRYIVLFEPATLTVRVYFVPTAIPPDDPSPFEIMSLTGNP